MNYELDIVPHTLNGPDCRLQIAQEALRLGWSHVLLVSDKFHEDTGPAGELTALLQQNNIDVSIYANVNSEPDTKIVEEGFNQFRTENCNGIIALGGGSPIDTAKTINVLVNNPGTVTDFMGVDNVPNRGTGIIAIPTTSGTGSEATKVVVIADAQTTVKMTGRDRAFLPAVAILDYKLTMTMPPALTAAVGVDTLTHAIEAYVSKQANPFTDAMALDAIKRIAQSLTTAVTNPTDEQARSEMLTASYHAGLAFSNASVALVHSMSEPLGACFHIPHGLSNAMLLPAATEFSIQGAPDRYATIARQMNLANRNTPDNDCCKILVEYLHRLNKNLKIPTPTAYGIDSKDYQNHIDKMATDASNAGSTANNPTIPTIEQIVKIYNII